MSFFDTFMYITVAILFPLLIYLVFSAYKNNVNSNLELDNAIFEILLLTTLFFIIKINTNNYNEYTILLINIPLLFSYIKGKKIFSLIISIILIIYFSSILEYSKLLIIIEYICCYLMFLVFSKKNIRVKDVVNYFTVIKSFFFSIYIYFTNMNSLFVGVFNKMLITIIIFHLSSVGYYLLLVKIEEVVSLNNSLKELEKEKTLRNSLFKLTHEIKNPIAVCKGYLDMLDISNAKSAQKYIDIIKNEIDRTLIIMDDFLDYTKVKVNKNIMDVIMLLEDTIDSMEPLFKKNEIKIYTEIIDDEIYINGDYNRLKQVLVNLFKNSVEAKRSNVKTKISVITKLEKEKIKISVIDNGKGIDKEDLKNIGQAFFTTKVKGTGLGILLSKEIISSHEGDINYYSEKGKGTSVIIELPIL